MGLQDLKVERRKLIQRRDEEIEMVKAEYSPKIKAITIQINIIENKRKKGIGKKVKQYTRR
jgi:hypothetical protein